MDLASRSKKIKLVALDVDGVLTSGQLIFGRDGELMKKFHAQDGLGLTVARKAGLTIAIITGRESQMVALRSAELKITDLYQGSTNKMKALTELMTKYNLTAEEIAYVGDDLNDLPILARVGLPCAVANAAPEVKQYAHLVTTHTGGNGAVREVVEHILKAQGKWQGIVDAYLHDAEVGTQQ